MMYYNVFVFAVFLGSCMAINVSVQYNGGLLPDIILVEMVPNQVMDEMVLDGGEQFILAGIDGFHTLSLLLASLVAHDRATEGTHTHHRKSLLYEHQTNTRQVNTPRGYST